MASPACVHMHTCNYVQILSFVLKKCFLVFPFINVKENYVSERTIRKYNEKEGKFSVEI